MQRRRDFPDHPLLISAEEQLGHREGSPNRHLGLPEILPNHVPEARNQSRERESQEYIQKQTGLGRKANPRQPGPHRAAQLQLI